MERYGYPWTVIDIYGQLLAGRKHVMFHKMPPSDPSFQEFPKMLYRACGAEETKDVIHIEGRTLQHRIVSSAKEQNSAKGWSETPTKALRKKRWHHWALVTLKPLWEKWEWAIKLLAAVLIIVAAILKLLPEPTKLENIPKPQPANSNK